MPPTDKILLPGIRSHSLAKRALIRSPSATAAWCSMPAFYAQCATAISPKRPTQAVFLVLGRKSRQRSRRTPRWQGWLLKAARYAAIDLLRKESRHARHGCRAKRPHALKPSIRSPKRITRLAAMEEALLSLTTADREALLLRYHHNEPFAQIAISLDTTLEAVRNYSLHQK